MTRVCLLGSPDVNLQYELLSRETSREALSTYDLERPFENALAVRTVSIGAAVSLLNDLQWYIVRFVDEAIVQEPSVDGAEWLSRDLATALRNGDVEPEETDEHLKVYGVEILEDVDGDGSDDGSSNAGPSEESRPDTGRPTGDGSDGDRSGGAPSDDGSERDAAGSESDGGAATGGRRRLVEPLFVRRTDGETPAYDLRDVDETLVVRLTEGEFSP